MGRYYTGDIDGKWWFGVQSSYTPERFGSEPSYYTYYINKENVEETMENIKEGLGDKIKMFEKFFKENTLLNQAFVKDNSKSIQQYLDEVSKGMTVSEFKRVAIG